MKHFDIAIGNPAFQDVSVGAQKQFAPPIYDKFLDAAYEVSDVVEMIHPARFLFNAGGTPKEWNQKMLEDPHFKVLYHEQDSAKIFPTTDIKGGIVISYRNAHDNYGAIGTYTPFPALNQILKKVTTNAPHRFNEVISNRGLYKFSKQMYEEHPTEMQLMSDARVGASSFERIPGVFTEDKPSDEQEYAQMLGLLKTKRVYRWFCVKYFNPVESFQKYKVMFPAANGAGEFGEVLTKPVIGGPGIGHTETFISIGNFDTRYEAESCYKYIFTKFCRAMLGTLKITQHCSPEKWANIPLQDFTAQSDIDWSKSISEIDQQLYAKYGLTDEEIEFIETHVKEMV